MKTITVLLSDDHTMVREGLRVLLETEEDIEIVAEVSNGRRAVEEAKQHLPHVVLLDISMPLLNGLEATRQIVKEVPSTKVLILSAHSEHHYVQHALLAGASGFLMKETAGDDVVQAIREIAKGNSFFSPPVTRSLLKQYREIFLSGGHVRTKGATLTSRQNAVLHLIAEGHPNKQIAAFLSLSIKTVEKQRQQLMNKLNIHNIAMLTRYAVCNGVVKSNLYPKPTADKEISTAEPGGLRSITAFESSRPC